MKKTILMDKYPIYSLEVNFEETTYRTVDAVIEHLKALVDAHKIATYIAIFDHYTHTKSIGGDINESIKDAKNLIFCFGAAIPNTTIIAARPRSFSVALLENSFKIEFLEPPKEQLIEVMEKWAKSLNNK
jgi:hypothetical protein